jgi:chemosensory pili system protein ChpA (sensor histidine kinase/response regulator)
MTSTTDQIASATRKGQRPCHVVIVESHGDSREMYVESLTRSGFRVTACPTVGDVSGRIADEVPDAIVTSLRLPGGNGFSLSAMLRGDARTAHIPVIALSSCMPDHERAIASGRFAAVLMKPCLPDTLRDALRAALGIVHPQACRELAAFNLVAPRA